MSSLNQLKSSTQAKRIVIVLIVLLGLGAIAVGGYYLYKHLNQVHMRSKMLIRKTPLMFKP